MTSPFTELNADEAVAAVCAALWAVLAKDGLRIEATHRPPHENHFVVVDPVSGHGTAVEVFPDGGRAAAVVRVIARAMAVMGQRARYGVPDPPGYPRRKLTRIVDTSHASRLVQAADVITFLYRRVFTHREIDERSLKAKIAMWNRLRPRISRALLVSVNERPGPAASVGKRFPADAQRARANGL